MNNKLILMVVIPTLLFAFKSLYAIEIVGGNFEDVVIVANDDSDSSFSDLEGIPPGGPDGLNVDKDGNIYVLDAFGYKVLKFDKKGKWIPTFRLQMKKAGTVPDNMTVDNQGNVYVEKGRRILKFSPQGKFLFRSKEPKKNRPDTSTVDKKRLSSWERWQVERDEAANTRTVGPDLCVDKPGRIYTTGVREVIYIRDSELVIKDTIDIDRKGYYYYDIGITQKEVGDDIYFRWTKYLLRTSLEEYSQNRKVDTVATLPQELIQYRTFHEEYLIVTRQAPMIEEYYLMGFDEDSCFYFYRNEWGYDKQDEPENFCKKYTILKYRLKEGRLVKEKEVLIKLLRDKEECSKRALLHFQRQFLVFGDGTIYWLHGTVDTVKVSKITFDK